VKGARMFSICSITAIDLQQMIGEKNVPKAIQAQENVLF
jgi:hypothetical protein